MIKYIFILFALFLLINSGRQDIIILNSGQKLKVVIVEELETKLRYKKCKEKDGPIYIIRAK